MNAAAPWDASDPLASKPVPRQGADPYLRDGAHLTHTSP